MKVTESNEGPRSPEDTQCAQCAWILRLENATDVTPPGGNNFSKECLDGTTNVDTIWAANRRHLPSFRVASKQYRFEMCNQNNQSKRGDWHISIRNSWDGASSTPGSDLLRKMRNNFYKFNPFEIMKALCRLVGEVNHVKRVKEGPRRTRQKELCVAQTSLTVLMKR